MIRLLLKSALIAGAVYLTLYACLQVAPALTAPLAMLMVGVSIGAAIREIFMEHRLRGLVRYSRLPFRPKNRRKRPEPVADSKKKEALGLAA